MTSTAPRLDEATVGSHVLGWDSVEFYVGNARASAGFLMSALGFSCIGRAGPETGVRDRMSYLLSSGRVRIVVTGFLTPDSEIGLHVLEHGDGVHELAWLVDDATATFETAVARGATPRRAPWGEHDDAGTIVRASVAGYGDTLHTFVERARYATDRFAPGFEPGPLLSTPCGAPTGLEAIDHVVGNVPEGELDEWVSFYERVFGFSVLVHYDDAQIATEFSALRSTVVWDGRSVVMPLNEPARGRKKSQIAEYLESYRGPGVQHIALGTNDIVATVGAMRERGIRFMEIPPAYYDEAKRRLEGAELDWPAIEEQRILVDRGTGGDLLQIFTEPIADRPTFFFEIIERRGATGFGEGNFKALFEAIEHEQERRGNL